jgi:chromosome partitioning protein
VIAFMNQKGGVGKTTSVVNLAAAIARTGRSTLVVDLDPQAHATLHLGAEPDELDVSVYDLLMSLPGEAAFTPQQAVWREREVEGQKLGLIGAVTDQAAAESELASAPERQRRLSQWLEPLHREYEFILLDCPPSLGLLTLNGLAAAREVVVPMQAHFLALQGVGKLLETVSLVARGINPRLRVSGVLLSMHDEQTRHAREVVADLEHFFRESAESDVPWRGARVLRPAIRRNIKLAECPSFGQTIFEYAEGCPGAQDYDELARNLVGEWDRWLERRVQQGREASGSASASDGAAGEAGRVGEIEASPAVDRAATDGGAQAGGHAATRADSA